MRLKLQHDAERAAKQAGVQVNQTVLDQLKEELAATDRLLKLKNIQADINFDRNTLGLSQEDVQIAQALRGVYPDITTALNSTEAAQIRLNNEMRQMGDISKGFANDLFTGLLRGESVMKSMTSAAGNLISKFSSAQLSKFMDGKFEGGTQNIGSMAGVTTVAAAGLNGYQSADPLMGAASGAMAGFATGGVVGAAIGGIAGAVGGLMGAADEAEKKLEESKKRWKEMGTQVIAFNAAAAGMDLGPLTQQLNSLHSSFMSLVNTAAEAEDWAAVVRLQTSYMKGIYRTVDEFANGAANLSPLETAIKGINDEAVGLRETLEVMGQLTPELARSIEDGLIRRLNETRVAFDEAAAAAGRARAAGFADQLFDVTNDTSTLAGALAALERKTAKVREEEVAAGGQALAALDELYFAERKKIIADFNDDALKAAQDAADAQRKVAQDLVEFVQNISKTIKDYLQGLKTGANSILSPQQQLAAAQANFNSTLALAQGGNRDALSSITQVASTLLDQAKSFYASSSGYTNIFNQVTSALEGIQNIAPEVVAGSDAALIAAINATTTAVAGTTGAVNTVAAETASQTSLINSSNSLLTAANNLAGSTNALLDAIRGLNDTAAQQLTLLRAALSPSALNFVFSTALGNGTVQNVSVNNQMVEALNKIVINTWAISRNTAFGVSNAAQATIGVFGEGGLVGGRPHNQGGTRIEAERGEYMIRKSAVDLFGVNAMDSINAGRMPAVPAPVSWSGGSSANDNGQHFQSLGQLLVRAMATMSATEMQSSREDVAALRSDIQRLARAIEGNRPATAKPGTVVRSKDQAA